MVIEECYADLVSFGKPYISNPELAERVEQNIPLTDWDKDTFYTPGKEGYLDYEKKSEEVSS